MPKTKTKTNTWDDTDDGDDDAVISITSYDDDHELMTDNAITAHTTRMRVARARAPAGLPSSRELQVSPVPRQLLPGTPAVTAPPPLQGTHSFSAASGHYRMG